MEISRAEACKGLVEAVEQYGFPGETVSCAPYGSGHINDTFLLVRRAGESETKYIVQRMNRSIFKNPPALMENIVRVTSFLRQRIERDGGNPERGTLNVVPTAKGEMWYRDSFGEYWRVYMFIDGAKSFDAVERPEDFYESAVAFGNFQRLLSDFPAETLHETIEGFHDTAARFAVFKKAVAADKCGRAASVRAEIDFVLSHEGVAHALCDKQAAGTLPLRVTHNDTKLNNIMMDDETRRGICVIDLDTVMPGLAVNDFGDSIRFGANTAAEDETDLDKVSLSLPLFELYTRGFIEGCAGRLTDAEIDALPEGARGMTFECGMRFLTDYLEGDVYFRIHREHHNLDRCRTQLALVRDMEKKWGEMQKIVRKYK